MQALPVSRRPAPASALALSLTLGLVAAPTTLGADVALAPIAVSGARLGDGAAPAPIGVVVIGGDAIRRAGGDLVQALRKLGVGAWHGGRVGAADFGPDLRAFGAGAGQNQAVLLDGARLAANLPDNALWSTVPLERIERVEITRGGAGVLYGSGAGAGVINVVTKAPAKASAHGGVFVEAGRFGQREGRASVAQAWDGVALDAAVSAERSDNARADSRFRQSGFSGGADWTWKDASAGVSVETVRQRARFQPPWSASAFRDAPDGGVAPEDLGALDSARVSAFAERQFGPLNLSLDVTRREKTVATTYLRAYDTYRSTYRSGLTQLAPRLRYLRKGDGVANEMVLGVDLGRRRQFTENDFWSVETVQRSRALYLRNEFRFAAARDARVAFGARRELFRHAARDPAYPESVERGAQAHNAWDLQGSYQALPALTLHAKAGQSYRVDDNGLTGASLKPLAGQIAHDQEIGAALDAVAGAPSLNLRLFRHRISNEIVFDQSIGQTGANRNLDPTGRRGAELDVGVRLAPHWRLDAQAQHVRGGFSADAAGAGTVEGDVALLPRQSLSARLSWLPVGRQSADVGVQWARLQRYGPDAEQRCPASMPSFTTVDARYARSVGAWELALSASNLADRRYHGQALSCRLALYRDERRQLKLSLRYTY